MELILKSWYMLWQAGWACLLRRYIQVFHAFAGAWGHSSWPTIPHGSNPPERWHRWIAATRFTLIYCLKVVTSQSCWREGQQSSCWECSNVSESVWGCFWHSLGADWLLNFIYLDTVEAGALFMQVAQDCSASDQALSAQGSWRWCMRGLIPWDWTASVTEIWIQGLLLVLHEISGWL